MSVKKPNGKKKPGRKRRLAKLFSMDGGKTAGVYMRIEPASEAWIAAQAKRHGLHQTEIVRRVLKWAIGELGR